MPEGDERRGRLRYAAAIAACLVLGFIVRADVMQAAPLADDYDHFAMTAGIYPTPRNSLELYKFVGAGERDALMERGRLPWWSDPEIRLAALRPLSSALVALDHGWLASDLRSIRLHSLCWWGLCMLAVAGLLRAMFPVHIAALALLIYALEEAHTFPLGWAANRHALVTTAFGAGALWSHVVARRAGRVRAPIHALALTALCLMSGEYALSLLAYVLAFELCGVNGPVRQRLAAVGPYVALAILYLATRMGLDYGVRGSGFYISPLGSPLEYLQAVAVRLPALLSDLVWTLPSELSFVADPRLGENLPVVQRIAALGALGILMLPAWRARLTKDERELRWLTAGALLSLLPTCATLATTRLLVAAAIGSSALFAVILARAASALRQSRGGGTRWLSAGVIVALGLLQLAAPARRALGDAEYLRRRSVGELNWALNAELPYWAMRDARTFVVSAPDWLTACALPYALAQAGRPFPRAHYLLSGAAESGHVLERVDRNTLEISVLDPSPTSFSGSVYRDAELRVGERVRLDAFEVEVLKVEAGQPTHFRIRFVNSLDDPRYWFLIPTARGVKHLRMPAVGEQLRLPAAAAGGPPPARD